MNISTLKSNNIVGFVHKKHKKVISEFFNSIEATEALPYDLHSVKFLWGSVLKKNFLQLFAVKINNELTYSSSSLSSLNGDVTRAYKSFGPFNEISVNIKMNQEGTKKWKIFTEKNIGKNIAIVLDDLVYTNPLVQSVITNGMSQISGLFSIQESNDLVNILNAGELPTSVNVIQTEVV